MSRRGRILLVVLAVLAVPAWFAWREAARWQHLRAFIALSEALDADLAEYESAVRRRPPRGAPFEAGPAEVHYRRAIDLEIEGGLDEAMSRRAMEEIAAGTRTASAGVLRSPRYGPRDEKWKRREQTLYRQRRVFHIRSRYPAFQPLCP